MANMNALASWLDDATQNDRFYGVAIAIVTNNQDPEKLGRVKVKFPWLSEAEESYWARIATPMAGAARGAYVLPEVEDEVLVAFEHGDMAVPYIIGSLWNGKDKPPVVVKGKENDPANQRAIVSRSGLTVLLDDTEGKEQIVVHDKDGKNSIQIDAANQAIAITSTEGTVTVNAKGNVLLESSGGDITISGKNINLTATEGNCAIEAKQECSVQATSAMKLNCSAGVKVNDGALEVV